MTKKIFCIFILISSLLNSQQTKAQDLLQVQDLRTINVDNLSENDIAKIESQLKSKNLSIEQLESTLISKGMSSSEYMKLKTRLRKNSDVNQTIEFKKNNSITNEETGRKRVEVVNKKEKDSLNSLVFGSEFFDIPTLNFEPNMQIATPANYTLGPGDELQISVFGVQQFEKSIRVSVEGKISIDNVGQIPVNGISIEAATQKIKNAISRVYSTVSSGQSQVNVSLSQIRTIKITIIGAKQPGNYSVSSLSTVYNALHLAGGPAKNGSYRNIELLRNNKIIKFIDIYDFLVDGDQSANIGLKDNDVIRIPPYTTRVTIEGEVKRPGIFELKKGENFTKLLAFASGFSDLAYRAVINVVQKTDKEYKVKDILESEFSNNLPQSGDLYRITKILNRFENRICIDGAVFRPDIYSFHEGMRVSELIQKADGLKEDAYKKRARIIRLKSDLTTEIVNVNLIEALEKNTNSDVFLKKEDEVTVFSILDFIEEYDVVIDGEIRKPGSYKYYENLTLNDLIIQAGGLSGSASKRIEVGRMVVSEEIGDKSQKRAEIFNIEISPKENEQAKNFILMPFDVINVRKMAVYEKPVIVSVSGAVNYEGKYVLTNKKEGIYEIIQRAGGLTSLADIEGIKIKRPIQAKQIEELNSVDINTDGNVKTKLDEKLSDIASFSTIPIDWEKIMKNHDRPSNTKLMAGDEIIVEPYNENVKIVGNVLLTSEISFIKGRGFNYYINAVGGVDKKGWKKRAYIIYPNGKVAITKNFLFIKSFPTVKAGSQIVVPEKPESPKTSTGEYVSIAGVLASLAGVVIAILRL